ncbi:MAG: PDZ domain-containing protein [bacterium]
MTKRVLTVLVVMVAAAGMAFAGGDQESAAETTPGSGDTVGTAPAARFGLAYGMGPARRYAMSLGFAESQNYVDADGVLITAVLEESAAEAAGLKRGDVILSIDGTEVSTVAGIHARIAGMRAGQEVDLRVESGDQVETVTVTLDDRYAMPPLGIRGAATPNARRDAMRRFGTAVRILEVADGSPADQAGIEPGHVITGIDGEITPGETVTVSYIDAESLAGASRFDSLDGPEVQTTTLTVGEEDGNAYVGVRYVPLRASFGFTRGEHRGFDETQGRGGGPRMRGGAGGMRGGPGMRGGGAPSRGGAWNGAPRL